MGFELQFENRFFTDFEDAFLWYDEKSEGLGQKLRLEIDKALHSILENPYFNIRYVDIRCFVVKTFPYMIHYVIAKEKIVVLALISTHMNPDEKWIK